MILVAIGVTFAIGWRPFIGPKARSLTDRTFERTPQRLERGRYLAQGCMFCHSEHDWSVTDSLATAPVLGAGMVMPFYGLPGRIVAPNITPDPDTGAGKWTDDQLARAIREGIGHDGRALFPMMPYPNFRYLTNEDLASIIVYLRSLPPLRHELPKTEIAFPVNYLIRAVPQPVNQPVTGDANSPDPVKRGAYLVRIGGCADCHTPRKGPTAVSGMDFAGGATEAGPWGSPASANITPDASGIGYYDEGLFLQVMRMGYVRARKLSPIMPVGAYRNLNDDDLKAMFAYLRTLKPVKHHVDNTEEVSQCRLCRLKHGGGNVN
jgi:mono/diheme cytochrome c family protein